MIIKLTLTTDYDVYVNVDNIKYFHKTSIDDKSGIYFTNDDYLCVKEDPGTIANLIKLAGDNLTKEKVRNDGR